MGLPISAYFLSFIVADEGQLDPREGMKRGRY